MSSCEELPEFCLLSSLFGGSHTCSHDLPEGRQTLHSTSDVVVTDHHDTTPMYSHQHTSSLACSHMYALIELLDFNICRSDVQVMAASPSDTSHNDDLKCKHIQKLRMIQLMISL